MAACACTSSGDPELVLPSGVGADSGAVVVSLDHVTGTGLFASGGVNAGLAAGVLEYTPRFPQWLDGATARGFLWLPPGASIDASDPDHWIFPEGTRAWQELALGGARIETRYLEKRGEQDWRFLTYFWETEQDAVAVERGLSDAGGTGHDIPHLVDCGGCHDNVTDRVLGVSAIQLDSALTTLPFSAGSPMAPELPGDATAQAALGYLHANCGACHNPRSVEFRSVDLELWLPVAALDSVEATPAHRTAVGVRRQGLGAGSALPDLRIAAGDPEQSALYQRMATRDPNAQMPPLGTKQVDAAGVEAVGGWIRGLGR